MAITRLRKDLPDPDPGTLAAIAKGCTCGQKFNAFGRGWADDVDGGGVLFLVEDDCPVHSIKEG